MVVLCIRVMGLTEDISHGFFGTRYGLLEFFFSSFYCRELSVKGSPLSVADVSRLLNPFHILNSKSKIVNLRAYLHSVS